MSSNRSTPKLAAALLLVASALSTSVAAADTATLVKDINAASGGAGSDPREMLRFGDAVYFAATSGEYGRELWRTDGTTAGTVLVADIARGTASAKPHGLTPLDGAFYFFADDGTNGLGLWRSDGSATGTKLVRAMPGGAPFGDGRMRAAGDVLYFLADGDAGPGLWRTDGTAEGTQIAVPAVPGPPGSYFPASPLVDPVALGNALLFLVVEETTEKAALWRTLGTPESTTLVASADPGMPGLGWALSLLTRVGGTVFFAANGPGTRALWKTDGTAAGTELVRTMLLSGLTEVSGQLFFAEGASASCPGWQCGALWKSDGSMGGTTKVTDVAISGEVTQLPGGGFRHAFVKVGDDFFFEAIAPQQGLWKSDGTAAGTVHVKQVAGGFPSIDDLVDLQGAVIFTADRYAAAGATLWRSDGSAGGTAPISGAISPSGLTVLGASVVFQGTDRNHGAELWKSDGTEAGTSLLRDIEPGGQTSNPRLLADAGGVLYFTADDGVHGTELWKSDGTQARTTLVADLTPGPASTDIGWLAGLGDAVLIGLRNDAGEAELWTADDAGPRLLHRFGPSVSISQLADGTATGVLGPVGGAFYFSARSGIAPYGTQLWRCDGAKATLVTELAGSIFVTATDGEQVYFGELGDEGALWRTDGTPAGTARLTPAATKILTLREAGGKVFFSIERELWFVDATSKAPTRVVELEGAPRTWSGGTLGREVLFFVGSGPEDAPEKDASWSLWKSDGTARGTTRIAALPYLPEYGAAVSGDTFYFELREPTYGVLSLWASDGTETGTRLVREHLPSATWPVPLPGGGVIFSAGDTSTEGRGIEPWLSDGTPAGTLEIQQVGKNARSSSPADFTVSGQRVFFTADDGAHGRELWALPLPTKPAEASGCACAAPGRPAASPTTALLAAAALAITCITRHRHRDRRRRR